MEIEQFDNIAANLEILAEEAAEIIQIKSKIMRFGLSDFHPKNKLMNQDKLEEEVGHFLAMVEILVNNKVLTDAGLMKAKYAKFKKLPKWYQALRYQGEKK